MRYFKLVFILSIVFSLAAPAMAMRFYPTRAQLEASETLSNAVLAKAIAGIDFDSDAFSRTEIQYCLDNSISLDRMVLYSPLLTLAQINSDVPTAWPNSEKEEGVQFKWYEYTRAFEVTGGYMLQYRGTYFEARHNEDGSINYSGAIISLPTPSNLSAWINMFNGFSTISEYEAVKIVPTE